MRNGHVQGHEKVGFCNIVQLAENGLEDKLNYPHSSTESLTVDNFIHYLCDNLIQVQYTNSCPQPDSVSTLNDEVGLALHKYLSITCHLHVSPTISNVTDSSVQQFTKQYKVMNVDCTVLLFYFE